MKEMLSSHRKYNDEFARSVLRRPYPFNATNKVKANKIDIFQNCVTHSAHRFYAAIKSIMKMCARKGQMSSDDHIANRFALLSLILFTEFVDKSLLEKNTDTHTHTATPTQTNEAEKDVWIRMKIYIQLNCRYLVEWFFDWMCSFWSAIGIPSDVTLSAVESWFIFWSE